MSDTIDARLFVPDKDRDTPLIDLDSCEQSDFVDLAELPIDSIIHARIGYRGLVYKMKIIQDETGRRVKIWRLDNQECFQGPINCLGYSTESEGRRAALKLNVTTGFPYFRYNQDGSLKKLRDAGDLWMDTVKGILLQKPK